MHLRPGQKCNKTSSKNEESKKKQQKQQVLERLLIQEHVIIPYPTLCEHRHEQASGFMSFKKIFNRWKWIVFGNFGRGLLLISTQRGQRWLLFDKVFSRFLSFVVWVCVRVDCLPTRAPFREMSTFLISQKQVVFIK